MARRGRSDALANVGLGMGLLPAMFGIGIALRPQVALDVFGMEPPTTAADAATLRGYMHIHAVRNVVVSLLLAGMRYRRDGRLLGFGLLACCLMAAVDGLVSRHLAGRGEWQHWGMIPVLVAVGGRLAWRG